MRNFLQGNPHLVQLKNRFEKEPNREYEKLSPANSLTELGFQNLIHNNYGICGQLNLVANQEGASRIKAVFNSIRSEDAEATSF